MITDYKKFANLMAFDVETTINSNPDIGPDPHSPTNRVVMYGYRKSSGDMAIVSRHGPVGITILTPGMWPSREPAEWRNMVLCGHNLKFDIAYALKEGIAFDEACLRECDIWDTQVGAYLLSGQRMMWPSLEDAREQSGITADLSKLNQVSRYFKAGIGADQIERDLLYKYFVRDLTLTLAVAEWQIDQVFKLGRMDFFLSMMRATRQLALMEYHGLRVDGDMADKFDRSLTILQTVAYQNALDCFHAANPTFKTELGRDPDFNSRTELAVILFGGDVSKKVKEQIGLTLKGTPKYKNIEYLIPIKGMAAKPIGWDGSVDAATLEAISKNNPSPFLDNLLAYRSHSKLLGTYVQPIRKKLENNAHSDDCIHPNFNVTSTATGRLSSSNPNFQNMPSDGAVNIKEMYIPREGCVFLEYDYKQMEVVVLAILSGCPDLARALIEGVDIHNATGELALGRLPTDGERRSIKAVNFGLIYGGGAPTLAEQSGLALDVTKKCIASFFKLYPGVKKWRDAYLDDATNKKRSYRAKTNGEPPEEFVQLVSPSGRVLSYTCYDPPAWKRTTHKTPSPTQCANYPVQSLATGDISQLMLWVLGKVLWDKWHGEVRIVNTVHDSFLIECPAGLIAQCNEVCVKTLQYAHHIAAQVYGFKVPIKLKVDGKRNNTVDGRYSWGSVRKMNANADLT